ncbi:hypothetical protein M0804_009906 [Polistes exclamans]|nr:hypothetical protein M0804_009906 [Polistes exclamans]
MNPRALALTTCAQLIVLRLNATDCHSLTLAGSVTDNGKCFDTQFADAYDTRFYPPGLCPTYSLQLESTSVRGHLGPHYWDTTALGYQLLDTIIRRSRLSNKTARSHRGGPPSVPEPAPRSYDD